MTAYYNEISPYAAQWLRNLIAAGHIAPGDVDERSIVEVTAKDLKGYTQCHFFAGIGVWSHALRQAGWEDAREVWTGSCPCQPFSVAGRGKGTKDERHLWPEFYRLIRQCKPHTIFGEQVSSKDGLAWVDVVSNNLERSGYAFAALDTCAAGVGAPHIRQRLYFVADAAGERWGEKRADIVVDGAVAASTTSLLGHAHAHDQGSQIRSITHDGQRALRIEGPAAREAGVVGGFWADADLIWCRDEKYRTVESPYVEMVDGTTTSLGRVRPGDEGKVSKIVVPFPLEIGATNRVGKLRAYGNSLVAPAAIEFVKSYLDAVDSEDGEETALAQEH